LVAARAGQFGALMLTRRARLAGLGPFWEVLVKKRYQVVIVGGGPVGVALAIDLGMREFPARWWKAAPQAIASRRGRTSPSARSAAFLFLGHCRRVARRTLVAADLCDRRDHRLRRLRRTLARGRRPRNRAAYYFQDNDRLPQYQMEAVLSKKLSTLRNVDVRLGWSATGVARTRQACR